MITHDAPGFSSRLRLANSPLPLAPPMRPPRAARGFRISGTTNSLCAAGGRGILSGRTIGDNRRGRWPGNDGRCRASARGTASHGAITCGTGASGGSLMA